MSTGQPKNLVILLQNGSVPSDPSQARAWEQAWQQIQSDPILKRSIRVICVNDPRVLNHIQHNQAGLKISSVPVFVTRKYPNGPRVWSITSYNEVFALVHTEYGGAPPAGPTVPAGPAGPTGPTNIVVIPATIPTSTTDVINGVTGYGATGYGATNQTCAIGTICNMNAEPIALSPERLIIEGITGNNACPSSSSESSSSESSESSSSESSESSSSESSESESDHKSKKTCGKKDKHHDKHHGKHHGSKYNKHHGKRVYYESGSSPMNVVEGSGSGSYPPVGDLKFGTEYKGDSKGGEVDRLSKNLRQPVF
jgi:hypothetical protein